MAMTKAQRRLSALRGAAKRRAKRLGISLPHAIGAATKRWNAEQASERKAAAKRSKAAAKGWQTRRAKAKVKARAKPEPKRPKPEPKRPKAERDAVRHRNRMAKALERIGKQSGMRYKVLAHRNADDTSDAELRMIVPRGVEGRDILIELSQVAKIPSETWLAFGGRYDADIMTPEERDRYIMWWGKVDVSTHYMRARYRGNQFATAISYLDKMRDNWNRKAREITIRLHWNSDAAKPRRKGKTGEPKMKGRGGR